MGKPKGRDFTIECPCCSATLKIDSTLQKVLSHESPPQDKDLPDLDRAAALLREQKERREALFEQSSEDQKSMPDLLERKFEEALKKSKDEPVTKPTRDIDL